MPNKNSQRAPFPVPLPGDLLLQQQPQVVTPSPPGRLLPLLMPKSTSPMSWNAIWRRGARRRPGPPSAPRPLPALRSDPHRGPGVGGSAPRFVPSWAQQVLGAGRPAWALREAPSAPALTPGPAGWVWDEGPQHGVWAPRGLSPYVTSWVSMEVWAGLQPSPPQPQGQAAARVRI